MIRGQNYTRTDNRWQGNPPHHAALATPPRKLSLDQILVSTMHSTMNLDFKFVVLGFHKIGVGGGVLLS